MISLGIVDLVLLLLLLLALYLVFQRRGLGVAVLVAIILIVVLAERLAPGTMARIGSAVQGLNQVNLAGPHLDIQPIVRFEK